MKTETIRSRFAKRCDESGVDVIGDEPRDDSDRTAASRRPEHERVDSVQSEHLHLVDDQSVDAKEDAHQIVEVNQLKIQKTTFRSH